MYIQLKKLNHTTLAAAVAAAGTADTAETRKARKDLEETGKRLAEARADVTRFTQTVARLPAEGGGGGGGGVKVTTHAPAGGGRGGGRMGGRGGREEGRGRGLRIDNRTTCLKVVNKPVDVAPGSLQSYFSNFGTVEKVEVLREGGKEAAVVKFASRRAAENAKANAKYLGTHLLVLQWYDSPPVAAAAAATPPTTTTTTTTSTTTAVSAGGGGGERKGGEEGGEEQRAVSEMEQQEQDLDALFA